MKVNPINKALPEESVPVKTNISSRIFNIITVVSVALFFLGLILFFNFLGSNWLFFGIGILLMIPLPCVIFFALQEAKHLQREEQRRIEKLKQNGEKIAVDLLNVQIKSNSWTESEITAPARVVALDTIIGQEHRHIKKVQQHHNVVMHTRNINGKEHECISYSNMELTSLKMHFAIQKQTYFYYDKNDTDNYYLDLEFLN